MVIDIPFCRDHLLLAVFDGHGGSYVSEYAESHLLALLLDSNAWHKYLSNRSPTLLCEALVDTFLTLDLHIQNDLGAKAYKCGCTGVLAVISPTHIICANVGDSRCVLGTASTTIPMSYDHKPNSPEETLRIIAAGGVWNKLVRCRSVFH